MKFTDSIERTRISTLRNDFFSSFVSCEHCYVSQSVFLCKKYKKSWLFCAIEMRIFYYPTFFFSFMPWGAFTAVTMLNFITFNLFGIFTFLLQLSMIEISLNFTSHKSTREMTVVDFQSEHFRISMLTEEDFFMLLEVRRLHVWQHFLSLFLSFLHAASPKAIFSLLRTPSPHGSLTRET